MTSISYHFVSSSILMTMYFRLVIEISFQHKNYKFGGRTLMHQVLYHCDQEGGAYGRTSANSVNLH